MTRLLLLCVALSLLLATRVGAIAINQIDDFQDGTTQDWDSGGGGNPNPPENRPDQGPAGLGDHVLAIIGNGGFGAGSNLVALNPQPFTGPSQWTGDYTSANVAMIFMSVRNPSAVPISLRLGIAAGNTFTSDGMFATTNAVSIPALSNWRNIVVPLLASDLTFSFSNTPGSPISDPNAALTQVTQLRILHSNSVSFRGEAIAAELLVDNVVALPEPSLPLQLGVALGSLALLQRYRRRFRV